MQNTLITCCFLLAFSYGNFALSFALEADRCLQCHGNIPASRKASNAPLLPESFSMTWQMHEFQSTKSPPFSQVPEPYTILPGQTFYDWSSKMMTEIYLEKCIDIFHEGRDFPCQFISIQDKTFFIKFAKSKPTIPESCCLWSKDAFWGPRPDVIQNMVFEQELQFKKEKTQWWILDILLPGPFGYGFTKHANTPVAFWFPVISGWVQQNFANFQSKKPDPKHFQLPNICLKEIPLSEK